MNLEELRERLSDIEFKVLQLDCERLTYRDIGEKLGIAPTTVSTHMGSVYRKLDIDLHPRELWKSILQRDFCPLLRGLELDLSPTQPDKTEEQEPARRLIEEIIEKLTSALFLGKHKLRELIEKVTGEQPHLPQPRQLLIRLLYFLGGTILALLIVLIIYAFGGFPPPKASKQVESPVVQYRDKEVTRIVVVTATSAPPRPSPTPIIQTREVEVTREVTREVPVVQTVVLTREVVKEVEVTREVIVEATTTPPPPQATQESVIQTEEPPSTPTPVVTPQVFVVGIEGPAYKLSDHSSVFTTRFWLDEAVATGSFLVLDTDDIHYANPVWVNGKLVGAVPGSGSGWQTELSLFIPASVLRTGENDLKFEAGRIKNNYDDFRIQSIRLEVNQAPVPPEGEAAEILIDVETHHIGDDNINAWSISNPESPSYTKFFELQKQPTVGALLILRTFRVRCAIPLRVNDVLLGNLPGFSEEVWTDDVQIYIPSSHLQAGGNGMRIDSVSCRGTSGHDDFMIKDIRILVSQ